MGLFTLLVPKRLSSPDSDSSLAVTKTALQQPVSTCFPVGVVTVLKAVIRNTAVRALTADLEHLSSSTEILLKRLTRSAVAS